MSKYRFAKNRKRSAFLPFLPIATPLSLGLTVITAIFLPSVLSVTRISRTAAGFRAFFMKVAVRIRLSPVNLCPVYTGHDILSSPRI